MIEITETGAGIDTMRAGDLTVSTRIGAGEAMTGATRKDTPGNEVLLKKLPHPYTMVILQLNRNLTVCLLFLAVCPHNK